VLTDTELEITTAVVNIDDRAEARLGGRVVFEGELDLALSTEQFPLALADPRLGGLADLQATIGGTLTVPAVSGTAAVRQLTWQSEAVGDIKASLGGSVQQGDLQLVLTSPEITGEIALDYEQVDSDYLLGVRMAEGYYAPLAVQAALREPVSVQIGADSLAFEQVCLTLSSDQLDADPGYLCANLDYPAGGLQLALEPWQVPRLPLPDSEVTLNGEVELAVDLTGFAPFVGSARVSFADLVAHHPDLAPLRLGNLNASIVITEDRLKATLSTPLDQTQELLLNGAVESLLAADPLESPISGSIYMELDGIWVAQSLLPMEVTYELENVRGRMAVNAVLAGRVDDPIIDGSLKLTDAGWQVLAVNAEVADLEALATLKGSERIDFRADSAVGAGSLALEGGIVGIDSEAPRLSTLVTFDGAELLNLPDYQAVVDGELLLEMGTDDLIVKGSVNLPRAEVLIADLPETAVSSSADEVIVDEEQAANVQQLRTTDLTLTLGDEVYLEAFGLSGRLSGNLRVTEAPGRLRSVTGVIRLNDARFEAYGQELTVERGQLTFTGPIDDPNVDVVATRTVNFDERDYRLSLLITGSANDLQTEVRSQPSLSEDDALALLITGRTFSQMTSSERSNVSGAALSMGLLNATGVTQNLADRLNLEEIILDQDAEGNMEVGAALRLNRNLYLRYTYGVFSRLGGVLLRYRLNNRISVQAKTGDDHSIEIRYGVD
jgi:translocation and assembly module TamB